MQAQGWLGHFLHFFCENLRLLLVCILRQKAHPNIDLGPPVRFALKDLWCGVRRRPTPSGEMAALGLVIIREPEVGNLHVHLRVEEKILGLEISVHHLHTKSPELW